MQRLIILVCFFILANGTVFAASLTQRPTIDFGSVGYVAGSSGFNTITIQDNGHTISGGIGDGHLDGTPVGSAGTATIGNFNIAEQFLSLPVNFQTNRSTGAKEVSNECGKVYISDFTTTGGTSASGTASNSSVSFPLGAKLTMDSFEGTGRCTISGTVTGPVQFRVGQILTSWQDVPVTVSITIVPYLSLKHDDGAVLNFGTICRSSTTSQTITVRPDGTTTSTNASCPVTEDASADSFTVEGYPGKSFDVSLPSFVNISNGSDSLSITNLTSSCSSNCTMTDSTYTFGVGGTLTVPANSSPGDYVGNYSVTITY